MFPTGCTEFIGSPVACYTTMWSEVGCIPQGNAAPASLDVTQLSELQALNLKLVYLGDK